MLVENSEKIQKLYGSTLEAERATTEVERQLSAVESDQETLESWLNHYEKEVDSMIASQQGGPSESISAPDQERERTYVKHLVCVTWRADSILKLPSRLQIVRTIGRNGQRSDHHDRRDQRCIIHS